MSEVLPYCYFCFKMEEESFSLNWPDSRLRCRRMSCKAGSSNLGCTGCHLVETSLLLPFSPPRLRLDAVPSPRMMFSKDILFLTLAYQ